MIPPEIVTGLAPVDEELFSIFKSNSLSVYDIIALFAVKVKNITLKPSYGFYKPTRILNGKSEIAK